MIDSRKEYHEISKIPRLPGINNMILDDPKQLKEFAIIIWNTLAKLIDYIERKEQKDKDNN